MATVKAHGFTVIELMLFLGVTGALFAALMVGVNGSITGQRYRESVQDYSSFLQNQYSEVTNTRDERSNDWKCTNGTVSQQPTGGDARGTTQCVLLGRAIQIGGNGNSLKSTEVIGVEPGQQASTSDIDSLVSYKPQLAASFDSTTTPINWESHLVDTNKKDSIGSILILRSPVSGLLRVFTSSSALPSDLTTMITPTDASTPLVNCMQGQSGSNPLESIAIDPRVAGPDGIVTKAGDSVCV